MNAAGPARMGSFPPRPDRFRAWFRATFPYGAKQYAAELGVSLKTAENRAMGVLPQWREEDDLIALFGEAYLGPVVHPRLTVWMQKAEARARALEADRVAVRGRLARGARAHRDLVAQRQGAA